MFLLRRQQSRCASPLQQKAFTFYKLAWYAFTCNALRVLRRLSHYLHFLLIRHSSSCALHEALPCTSPLGRLGGASFSSHAANYFARRQPHYGCVQQVLAHAQFHPHLCSFVPHFTKQHWQHTKFHCWNYPSVIFERNKADFADIAGIYGEKSNAVAAKNNHG